MSTLAATLTRPDPPVPPDGSCYQCGGPRHPERSRKYAGTAAVLDPFDSTTCCRYYHGVTLANANPNKARV